MSVDEAARAEIERLRDPRTVRACAERMLALGERGELASFRVDGARLADVAGRVVRLIGTSYRDPAAIPYHSRWRHFAAGGVDRAAAFERRLDERGLDAHERLRERCALAVTSVLLDAGAGPSWTFREPGTGFTAGRSEGLALASYHLFLNGGLSVDALESMSEETLARAFQATPGNPLVGLAGRAELMRRLGAALRAGHIADVLRSRATSGVLTAAAVLEVVLDRLSPIWPGRQAIAGVNLGDVWPHPRLGLVPFHKLSQWLTYSLLEPLEWSGIRVVGLGELTGLAEYRNGGLFLDAGVLVPKDDRVLSQVHAVGSELIVEWRALTVALLDRTAVEVRARLGLDAEALPLAKVLEGGTWAAGREIARERRPDGRPPLAVESDGTVF